MIKWLGEVASVAACVSEEDEAPVVFANAGAKYIVIFDPLDGSSNIDVNVNVGTIFSVQELQGGDLDASILQQGTKQVAAGYVVYGPSTVMVMTTGAGVTSGVERRASHRRARLSNRRGGCVGRRLLAG